VGRFWVAACVAVACAAPSGVTIAATCPAPRDADPGLVAVDGQERLLWIDRHLTRDAARGRLWADAWALGIGAAGLGSLVPVPFVAAGDRIDWYTSAATAAIGIVPFVVSPLSVTRDAPKLHEAIAGLPSNDDAQVCRLLVAAERDLAAGAADEKWQQGWWVHAGNIAFNTAVTLFLGLGYHHWTSGLINGGSGALVGEIIIFTQPTGAVEDAAAYSRGDLSENSARAAAPSAFVWSYGATF
jgi:hypothetical protein